jgi:stage IV sporulation protein FB
MGSSIKLFSIWDIDIRVHITFPLILLWAAFQFGSITGNLSGALFGVVAISLLFVLVTLHELGHSYAALRYGVPVKQIVLSPIGGVAQLASIPDKPLQEFVIAIAGPLVNVVIAVLMGAVVVLFGLQVTNPMAVLTGLSVGGFTLLALFSYVFVYNIFLAAFNLIPAFPLDGGRVFRALLAMRLNYVTATNIASAVGRAFAVALGIYAFFTGGIFLILIAVFVYMAAGQEAAYVRMRSVLRGYTVQQIYSAEVHRIPPSYTIQQAFNLMAFTGQSALPVTFDEQLVGIVTRPGLLAAMRQFPPYATVDEVMLANVRPVDLTTDLYDVQQRMAEEQAEALPVTGNGRFMGLISARQVNELLRWLRATPQPTPHVQGT